VDLVADLVTRASDAYGSSQADLVRELGMKPLALTQWRGGKRRPSPATLRKMAKELIRKSDELRYLSLKLEAVAADESKRGRKQRTADSR
jgi:transcriptional regulator with XRE-family HTH domain